MRQQFFPIRIRACPGEGCSPMPRKRRWRKQPSEYRSAAERRKAADPWAACVTVDRSFAWFEDRAAGCGDNRVHRWRTSGVHETSGSMCTESARTMRASPVPHVAGRPDVAPRPPSRRLPIRVFGPWTGATCRFRCPVRASRRMGMRTPPPAASGSLPFQQSLREGQERRRESDG